MELVDWYHATEHLGEAKKQLYPEDGAAASRWYNRTEPLLFTGHASQVARSLRQSAAAEGQTPEQAKALADAARYFETHRFRIAYQDRRNEGWLIGSGMVESGAKQFKARVGGAGMRWSRAGAENLLPVRAAIMTSKVRFDSRWASAYANSPQL